MGQPFQQRPNRAQKVERNERIMRLRVAGMSERAIAAQVGVAPSTVNRVVADVARATVQPLADEFRDLEIARLDSALVRATAIMNDPKAMDGDRLKAVAAVVRISESRRRLLGLDAPVSMDVSVNAQNELDAQLVTEALSAAIAALELGPELAQFAFGMAAWVLGGKEGPLPERPAPRLALMPAPPKSPETDADAEPPAAPNADPEPFRRRQRAAAADVEAEAPADPGWASLPRELRLKMRPHPGTRTLVDHGRDVFNSPRS